MLGHLNPLEFGVVWKRVVARKLACELLVGLIGYFSQVSLLSPVLVNNAIQAELLFCFQGGIRAGPLYHPFAAGPAFIVSMRRTQSCRQLCSGSFISSHCA